MGSFTIDIPWRDKILNDNVRAHWSRKANAKSDARHSAFWLAKQAKITPIPNAVLQFYYYPPDKRRRDAQNMPGMMKTTIDGIADAMGIDDHKFQCVFPTGFEAVVKGGMVKIIIRPAIVNVPIEGTAYPEKVVWK